MIEFPITSTKRPYLNLYLALTDAGGRVLIVKSLGGCTVSGSSVALVPALHVLGVVDDDLHLGLHGGNPVGFVRYDLHVGTYVPSCGFGLPSFTFTDSGAF